MIIDSPEKAREWIDDWKRAKHSELSYLYPFYRSRLKRLIAGFRNNLRDYEVLGYTESAENTREILAVLEAAAAELEDCA